VFENHFAKLLALLTSFVFQVGWLHIEGDENVRAKSDEGQFHNFGAIEQNLGTDFRG
jgi:hypothetical protein